MERIPEPRDLMDDVEQARAYAYADFSEANGLFIDLIEREADGMLEGPMLDLGCGPAAIPIALARRHAQLTIDAIDGAQAMLELARTAMSTEPDLQQRIRLQCRYLPCDDLPQGHYPLLASNSLLHHLGDPAALWQTIARCARPGARVVVMDLARPNTEVAVDALVESHTIDAPDVLRRDFRNSLLAAYTVDEIERQVSAAGLDLLDVRMVSDRHWAAIGEVR